jgi:hypothetical protein
MYKAVMFVYHFCNPMADSGTQMSVGVRCNPQAEIYGKEFECEEHAHKFTSTFHRIHDRRSFWM